MTQEEILAKLKDRLFTETSADHIKDDLVEAIRALDTKRMEGEDVFDAHREVASLMQAWLLQV